SRSRDATIRRSFVAARSQAAANAVRTSARMRARTRRIARRLPALPQARMWCARADHDLALRAGTLSERAHLGPDAVDGGDEGRSHGAIEPLARREAAQPVGHLL